MSVPLLGADFLQHYNLLVDIKGCHIVHTDCPESIIIRASTDPVPTFRHVPFLSAPQCVQKLLSYFPDVLSLDWFPTLEPCQGVRHHLLTNPGPPAYAEPWRLDPEKLFTAKAEFSAMEEAGIIQCSFSPWSSPLHMVKKKDGG